jgi:hypothetical protein
MAMSGSVAGEDQAQRPVFRGLLVVQLLAAVVFGVIPFIVPDTFASLFGYRGDEPLIFRLAGAATAGYGVTALVALAQRSTWGELRIAITATLGFNVAAVLASLLAVIGGDRSILPVIVLFAAATFSVLSATWLRLDLGPAAAATPAVDQPFRIVLALATLSAAVFGLLPLLVPGTFASLFNVAGTDVYIFRVAGAATLGYAVAGILELRAAGHRSIRLQNLAAIGFNTLGAIGSLLAIVAGQGGLLAPVILVAATFFAISLTWLDWRAADR